MNFSGSQTIPASIEQVWKFLEDPRKIASCIPDVQNVEEVGPEHWRTTVPVGVGLLKTKATVDVTRSEVHEPDHMALRAFSKALGNSAEVIAKIDLASLGAMQTRLDWQANINLTGMLASMGGNLLKENVEKEAGRFFSALKNRLQTS